MFKQLGYPVTVIGAVPRGRTSAWCARWRSTASLPRPDLLRRGQPREIEQRVDLGDLDLMNAAKASILRRRSDECLYEYVKLQRAAPLAGQIAANQSSLEQ